MTLSLTLEASTAPISGVLAGAGEATAFSGWIELAALIEERRPGVEAREWAEADNPDQQEEDGGGTTAKDKRFIGRGRRCPPARPGS